MKTGPGRFDVRGLLCFDGKLEGQYMQVSALLNFLLQIGKQA